MAKITDELVVRGNRVKNRIVMAPMVTFSFHGDNGSYYGQQHIAHYTERAIGGAGLIIVQATRVAGAGNSTNMWSPDNITALQQIVSNCHAYGAAFLRRYGHKPVSNCGNLCDAAGHEAGSCCCL